MANIERRPLKVFLCHASGDKPYVRDLYKRLVREGIDAWLDQEKLLPGQDWRVEIPRAVQEADVVVICLSNKSITKEGYIQKEIKFALDSAEEKPDGTIFLIPARIEDCVVPEKLSRWQWVDLLEENGFVKLLRSLKLRADKVGASLSPSDYQDEDTETERRLDQFYTEGLAAFYTEDWNRAIQRFQMILRERPNHKGALEKLEEAEHRRDIATLYSKAYEACQAEKWEEAIQTLADLLKKAPDYKDTAELLLNAKKQARLGELYFEAKKLHAGGKWQAVIRVFDQIHVLEPNHPDPEMLLQSAQKEAAELKRLADLNDLYSRAVREMDAGKWKEARGLLEQVHKAQTGFLETEQLLRKVEDEINKVEKQARRVNEVNILYEQAHGLVRAKSWRKALETIDEIRKLDNDFEDKDGIVKQIKSALALEEDQAQKQNYLAALYTDAVRLLKEEKYSDALARWEEVRSLDPKYPDRQWVQRTSKRKLAEMVKSSQVNVKFVMNRSLWAGIIVVGVIVAGVIYSNNKRQNVLPTQISAQTETIPVILTATEAPQTAITSPSTTSIPVTSDHTNLAFYEGFDDTVWDGKINPSFWSKRDNCDSVSQQNGSMVFKNSNMGCDLILAQPELVRGEELGTFEAKLMVDDDHQGGIVTQEIDFFTYDLPGGLWYSFCGILADSGNVSVIFSVENPGGKKTTDLQKTIPAEYNQWYVFRMEVDPLNMTFSCQVDGKTIGSVIPKDAEMLRNAQFERLTEGTRFSGASATSYIDYIQILP